jgi:hypothetical protein
VLATGLPNTTDFEHHQHRMLYKSYRQAGLFYGSGVVEAGCRAVIGQRLKNSGMFWTESGARSVLDLRCALKSNRWDECWDRLHDSKRLSISPSSSVLKAKVRIYWAF